MSTLKYVVLAVILAVGFPAGSALAADDGKKKDPKDMKADEANEAGFCPVCKGEFKPVYHYDYMGKEYHFKTRACQKEFAADPTKFGAVGKDWKPDPKPADTKPDDKKDTKKDDKKPAK
jgi:YHS domain-containing protein